jgi:hypothetical protein
VRSILGCNRGRRRNFGRRVLCAHTDCWKDIGMEKSSKEAKRKMGTRKEWLAARLELLQAEKEHTRRGDKLALMRQELPWVLVDKEYRFETEEGQPRYRTSFKGVRNSSSTTSCLDPTTPLAARLARRLRTDSMASRLTWLTTT